MLAPLIPIEAKSPDAIDGGVSQMAIEGLDH